MNAPTDRPPIDSGTAYEFARGTHDATLTEVGPGRPMGELMRRYWQPIGLAADAGDLPREVRVLGEDLILFRDRRSRPGLLHPRCAHRGTSLLYGRVEDDGIRCCYHGWMFDTQGRCVDQPCEPADGTHKDKVRQPWYPVADHYGLVWAYMGPPEKQPLLPRYSVLENLQQGEQLFTDDGGIGGGAADNQPLPFNWLQHFENIHDPAHFLWLHYFHSGSQFGRRFGEFDSLDFAPWKWLETQSFRLSAQGVTSGRRQTLPDGRGLTTVVETLLPAVRVVPNPFGQPGPVDSLGFVLPVDDHGFRIFTVLKGRDDSFFKQYYAFRNQRLEAAKADPDYWQRFPGDYEAQGSQGRITLHSEEHLASSDRGIVMLRRLLLLQIDAMAEGKNPAGVAFEPDQAVVQIAGGAFLE